MGKHTRRFKLIWSEEDQEYVGLCIDFPSLSCLDRDPIIALQQIINLVRDIDNEKE